MNRITKEEEKEERKEKKKKEKKRNEEETERYSFGRSKCLLLPSKQHPVVHASASIINKMTKIEEIKKNEIEQAEG